MRTPGFFATLWLCTGATSCLGPPGEGAGECAQPNECAALSAAPCAGCPPPAAQLCIAGACVEREPDTRTVIADVSIERGIAPRAISLVHALVAGEGPDGPLRCADAFDDDGLSDALNVWSAGYKSLSGGSLHPALTLGRVPAGTLGVVLWVTDGSGGSGEVLGRTCVGPLTPTDDPSALGIVEIRPIAD